MYRQTILVIIAGLLTLLTGSSMAQNLHFKSFSAATMPAVIKTQIKGQLNAGLRWSDRLGENYAVFSTVSARRHDGFSDNSVFLQAKHFTVVKGKAKLVRFIRELKACPDFDNVTRFVNSSIGVTDLDGDGYGELSFVYFTDCVSDMSPYAAKLMLLENGKKYPIRGFVKYVFGGDTAPSEYKLGREFNNAPAAFKAFALKLWARRAVVDVNAALPR